MQVGDLINITADPAVVFTVVDLETGVVLVDEDFTGFEEPPTIEEDVDADVKFDAGEGSSTITFDCTRP